VKKTTVLDMFFNPQAVAVIGASRTPGKLGYALVHNIVQHGYQGAVYPINPAADQILGLTCYPDILAVPGPVDLAVVAVPARHVPAVLVECGEKGVKGAVIISAGFRETGHVGRQREREIVEIGRRYGMRLIGPNCLGVIDTLSSLNASLAVGMPRRGTIAFLSQSGALCTAVLDMALAEEVGFSHFVSLGNKADADEIAFIEAWRDDPHTRVIMAYLEGIEDGAGFMRVAQQVSRDKPILCIKAGITSAGSRAVSLHTGMLAGSELAYEAAFRQSGVIRARSIQDLFDYAIAFARQPPLRGDRIAIITNAGGPGIMATDACEQAGFQLASFAPRTEQALRQALPTASSVLNPVDLLGDAPAGRYRSALEAVLRDPNVAGTLVILTPQVTTQIEESARVIGELARQSDRPILGCFMGRERVGPGIRLLNRYEVPNYPVPERAVAALAAMMHHRRWRERPPLELETFDLDGDRLRQALAGARAEGRTVLTDVETGHILEACGIRTPRTFLAGDAEMAAYLAREIGFPVAVKVASPEILHRTDVGAVCLNLTTPEEVSQAFALITYRAQQYMAEAEIWGCLVQEMVPAGKELVIGMIRDPRFGPLLTLNWSGAYRELCSVPAFRLAPFGRREAGEMIAEMGIYPLLQGVRGERPADLEAVVETLLRLSQLALDYPEIAEFSLDPLVVFEEGQGVVGIDMRLVLS